MRKPKDFLPKTAEGVAVGAAMAIGFFAVLSWLIATAAFDWTFSPTSTEWGQFGDYMGGLLNPTIALAALIVLSRGTRYQKEELEATRRHFETESKKAEVYRLIESAENNVKELLKFEVMWVDRSRGTECRTQLRDVINPDFRLYPLRISVKLSDSLNTSFVNYSRKVVIPALERLIGLVNVYSEPGDHVGYVHKFYLETYSPLLSQARARAEEFEKLDRNATKSSSGQKQTE